MICLHSPHLQQALCALPFENLSFLAFSGRLWMGALNPKPKQHEFWDWESAKTQQSVLACVGRSHIVAYYLAADFNANGKIAIGLADTLLITHIIPIVVEHEFLCVRPSRKVRPRFIPHELGYLHITRAGSMCPLLVVHQTGSTPRGTAARALKHTTQSKNMCRAGSWGSWQPALKHQQ